MRPLLSTIPRRLGAGDIGGNDGELRFRDGFDENPAFQAIFFDAAADASGDEILFDTFRPCEDFNARSLITN